MFRTLLIGLTLILPTTASAGSRVALLIGEGDYFRPPPTVHGVFWPKLTNPPNDVTLIAAKLAELGFDTKVLVDKTREQINSEIDAFSRRAAGADDAVIYYAGHAFEYQRHNYIVPIDAPAELDSSVLDKSLIDLDRATAAAAKARRANVIFLDACRTANPFLRLSGETKPYVNDLEFPPTLPIVVVYSTARGQSAFDNVDNPPPSKYSPFAWYLSQFITVPRVSFGDVFTAVNRNVQLNTKIQGSRRPDKSPQTPYMLSSLTETYYFQPVGGVTAGVAPATSQTLALASPKAARSGGRSTRGVGGDLGLTMDYLAQTDEPVVVAEVLSKYRPEDIQSMATDGDPMAAYLLGYMFEWGRGAERNLEQARYWLEQAAKSELAPTQLELAYFLQAQGSGPADTSRVRPLMESAAAHGFAKAQAHLANLLMSDGAQSDYDRGLELYRSAAQQGYPQALFALAWLGDAPSKSRLETLAREGDPAANQWLCELAPHEGMAARLEQCLTAAKSGSYLAQTRLADAYKTGDGVAADPVEARHWARVALSQPEIAAEARQRLQALAQ